MAELHGINICITHAKFDCDRFARIGRDSFGIVKHDFPINRVAERLTGGETFSFRINQRHKEITHSGRREIQPQFIAIVGQRFRHGDNFLATRMQ